jgi:hypothetical protein
VLVTAISSVELQWHNGIATGLSAEPRAVGRRVAQDLLPHLSSDTIGLFVFPDGISVTVNSFFTANFDDFFAGLEENLPSGSFRSGVGEPAMTSILGHQLINIATTKSSPMGSPTLCSQVRHRLVGL